MALITAAQLRLFAPRCDYMAYAPILDRACAEAGIDTPRELRHFMAQLHHESVGLTRFEENLNWRTPERLDAYFASVKSTQDAAALIARGPKAIANRIYAHKGGNGSEATGDGWRFRGRGPIQLTGRANYERAGPWIGANLLINPDLVALPAYGFRIAAHWWRAHGLNAIVEKDPGEMAIANIDAAIMANELDDCRQARRIINGGQNGIDDTIRQLRRAGTIWRD